jgi:hypothetical protein
MSRCGGLSIARSPGRPGHATKLIAGGLPDALMSWMNAVVEIWM